MNVWTVKYEGWKPDLESLREALCTLGNGYFATRGAGEESKDDDIHYPGTYLAGGFDRLESKVSGENVENEDFVNFPNWLILSFKPEGGDWLNLDELEVLDYTQNLILNKGILERKFKVKDDGGRITNIHSQRIVHMRFQHIAALQWKLTPVNWSGKIYVKTALDGTVINNNVARYRDLRSDHLNPIRTGNTGGEGIFLEVETKQSRIRMAKAARTRFFEDGHLLATQRNTNEKEGYIEQIISFDAKENHEIRIEKIVNVYTSRDYAVTEPVTEACTAVQREREFDALVKEQEVAWKEIWNRCDIEMNDRDEDQLVLRLHIFHLMQIASLNIIDLDVGIPSRGLHGEAYRGHILWDELFIFPFINFSIPEITRELLMYRYRRLPEARYAAEEAGYKGAMFPWQSGSNGREESQKIHLNPQSGRWIPDNTYLQRHVNVAIAFNIWQYYQVSKDIEFLSFYGAEMFLDIASFWASKTSYNAEKERYEILKVVGPDEYHTSYPDSEQPGINNNAYTNIMVVWVLIHAQKILDVIMEGRAKELMNKLNINQEELKRWDNISRKMYVPFVEDDIISQFEGFENLEELDWDKYHEKYGEILRLDRIMESENDDVNRYKASKQADVLMIFYLLSAEELKAIFERLDYDFNTENIHKNIQYYEERTSHGSTLSKLVHSWVMARSNRRVSWHNFQKALMSDFKDIQGGTTHEGIHLGAMAGTVDLIQRCYTGLEVLENSLKFNPTLPDKIKGIKTRYRYRGHWLLINLNHKELCIQSDGGWADYITINFNDQEYIFKKGDEKTFKLQKD